MPNDEDVKTVGDIIKGKETHYPYLDRVGDTGWLLDKETGGYIGRYVIVAVERDPKTSNAIRSDIQITSTTDPDKILPNRDAKCTLHEKHFPCSECEKLAEHNYG